jgi:hypothetical protein
MELCLDLGDLGQGGCHSAGAVPHADEPLRKAYHPPPGTPGVQDCPAPA